jgi:hypothetical protein
MSSNFDFNQLNHSNDEKRSQYQGVQTPNEDENAAMNVDAQHDFFQTRDSQQITSSRQSSYYARGGPNHEFKSYLLDGDGK